MGERNLIRQNRAYQAELSVSAFSGLSRCGRPPMPIRRADGSTYAKLSHGTSCGRFLHNLDAHNDK